MHRLLVETALLEQETPLLPKDAAKHLKVLRPEVNEPIELFDGRGRWRIYSFVPDGGASSLVAASALLRQARVSDSLTLFACVTKGSRWDWTLEKATELGVTRIVPVISARTIVRLPPAERAAKRERWQRIAEDAARQSDTKWVPEVLEAVDFKDVLPLVKETTCFIGALTTPPSPHLLTAADGLKDESAASAEGVAYATFIGPEGDLTPAELSALLEIAIPTSFGPAILRAETAALFALSVLSGLLASRRNAAKMI